MRVWLRRSACVAVGGWVDVGGRGVARTCGVRLFTVIVCTWSQNLVFSLDETENTRRNHIVVNTCPLSIDETMPVRHRHPPPARSPLVDLLRRTRTASTAIWS